MPVIHGRYAGSRTDWKAGSGIRKDGLRKPCAAPATKPKRVVAGIALQEHDRHGPLGHDLQSLPNQRRSDPLALPLRQHRDGAEHLHVDEPRRSVKHAAGEHHVADDLTGLLGHQRQPARCPHRLAERVDKAGDGLAVISERHPMKRCDRFTIFSPLSTQSATRYDGRRRIGRRPRARQFDCIRRLRRSPQAIAYRRRVRPGCTGSAKPTER